MFSSNEALIFFSIFSTIESNSPFLPEDMMICPNVFYG